MGVGRAAEPEMLRRRFEGCRDVFAATCVGGGREGKVERRRV